MFGLVVKGEREELARLIAMKEHAPSEARRYSELMKKDDGRSYQELESSITPVMKRDWTAREYVQKTCNEYYIEALKAPEKTYLTRQDEDVCYMICKSGSLDEMRAVLGTLPVDLKKQWLDIDFDFRWRKKIDQLNPKHDPKQGAKPLHIATIYGHPELIECLVKEGADINVTNKYGNTPLHLAALEKEDQSGRDNTPTLQKLLEHNASQTCRNQEGLTPFDLSIHYWHGFRFQEDGPLPEHAKDLLKVAPKEIKGEALHSALLHTGSNDQVFINLLEEDNDLAYQDKNGNTPLHISLGMCAGQCTRKLLEKNPPVDIKNAQGDTPLHRLVRYSEPYVIWLHPSRLIDRGANRFSKNNMGLTTLELCIERGRYCYLDRLLELPLNDTESQEPDKDMLMLRAIVQSPRTLEVDVCEQLFQSLKDSSGDTFPMKLNTLADLAASADNLDALQWLVSKGADSIDLSQAKLNTLLNLAASSGNLDTLKWLLSKGAELNSQDDRKGYTALHHALVNDDTDMAMYLLDLPSIDVNHPSRIGTTPLHHAAKRGRPDIVRRLLDKGANPLACTTKKPKGLKPSDLVKVRIDRRATIKDEKPLAKEHLLDIDDPNTTRKQQLFKKALVEILKMLKSAEEEGSEAASK